jgi:hypothetical protein
MLEISAVGRRAQLVEGLCFVNVLPCSREAEVGQASGWESALQLPVVFQAFEELLRFVSLLNGTFANKPLSSTIDVPPAAAALVRMLVELETLIDEVPPIAQSSEWLKCLNTLVLLNDSLII